MVTCLASLFLAYQDPSGQALGLRPGVKAGNPCVLDYSMPTTGLRSRVETPGLRKGLRKKVWAKNQTADPGEHWIVN